MSSKSEIDLLGVVSPVCLLKCKNALDCLDPGHVLEVLVQDPEVVEDLIKIVERSQYQLLKLETEKDYYRIHIRKT